MILTARRRYAPTGNPEVLRVERRRPVHRAVTRKVRVTVPRAWRNLRYTGRFYAGLPGRVFRQRGAAWNAVLTLLPLWLFLGAFAYLYGLSAKDYTWIYA